MAADLPRVSGALLAGAAVGGVPGPGGDIAAGEGSVWVTMDQVPLMRIDVYTNKVVQQWIGPGGDSLRAGLGSVWVTNHEQQNVWRVNPKQP